MDALLVLARTPRAIESLVGGLPESWIAADEGPGTFSTRGVLVHLIHGERTDWMPRVRRLLEHGENLAFEPFDRFASQPGEERAPIAELCATFSRLRAESLAALGALSLSPRDLQRRGRHPDFGPVTLGQLLATWVVHDLDHLGQIARVLAKHQGGEVGPWIRYLPILTRR